LSWCSLWAWRLSKSSPAMTLPTPRGGMATESLPFVGTAEEMAEALDVLASHFDIADVSERETEASLDYTQSRITAARSAVEQNPSPRERVVYGAWLDFFESKVVAARIARKSGD
jgi:hypothetical protein